MKVVAVQMPIVDAIEENFHKVVQYIEKASGNDVIVFPETCLLSERKLIQPIQKYLRGVRKAALTHNIAVIFGSYVRDDGKTWNRIFVVDRHGEIVHRYNKKNPYLTEREFISKGRVNRVFRLNGVPCAVINCWDYAFPEYLRKLAKQGAQVIFCPAYLLSHPLTSQVLLKMPQVRAFDCMSYFVMVDSSTEECFRHSRICHPLRELAAIDSREGMIQAELNLEEIGPLRERFMNF